MAQPVWITPAGSLGTIPEGIFFQLPLLAEDPTIVVTPTSVSTVSSRATFTFQSSTTLPYNTNSQVVMSGFSPAGLNGTYTVLQATNTSITVANSTRVYNLPVRSISATGSSVTLNFPAQQTAPFTVGEPITVSGFAPIQYNGTYTVTGATNSSVTFNSTVTDIVARLGTVSNVVAGTITNVSQSLYYEVIAGTLPPGIQCEPTGLIIGIPQAVVSVQGVPQPVSRDITFKFAARVYTERIDNGVEIVDRLADRTFTLTITGQDAPEWITPPGQIAQFYDGTQVTDLQLEYTDTDPGDTVVVSLKAGSLPPGLSVSRTGLISGFISPLSPVDATAGFSRDGQGYDEYPFDFSTRSTSFNYEFALELSDGKSTALRTFSIFVYSKDSMTADTTDFTADNTFITADVSPVRVPIITAPTPGSLGVVRNDNFFAVRFVGLDLDGDIIEYSLGYPAGASTLPGLSLDPGTGWLYGYIPNLGVIDNTYEFYVQVFKQNNPTVISGRYNYNLRIIGPIDTDVTWISPADLGIINNGATSTFVIEATNKANIPMLYRLKPGAGAAANYVPGVYNSLPQGLELFSTGEIAGRVSFNTFALDGGVTTFDVTFNDLGITGVDTETTFDMKHEFTVNAYSENGLVNVFKTFTITVNRAYNEPYENLYIQAMPPLEDRAFVDSLLTNQNIFQPDLIYRPTDPNFGVATKIVYNHAYGLRAATLADYVASLDINHYWKNLTLGEIKVAQATNPDGSVLYDVVYSQVIDNLVNDQGQSVSKEVTLPYPIGGADSTEITTVYPNSLVDMRDQVIDTVGQLATVLPQWMTSKQVNGRVLGFTPAWVLCYAKPGKGEQIAYYIRTEFGERLNLVDFEVDRYELDRLLSKNWDPVYDSTGGSWIPTPPEATTFDVNPVVVEWYDVDSSLIQWINQNNEVINWISAPTQETTFDQNSLQFIVPVDMYSNSQEYDKYLVFPRRNILE